MAESIPPKDRRMGIVALSLQCRLHLGAQDGRNSAPTYPVDRGLMALAAEAPRHYRRATDNKHRSFYGSNDGELIRHAVFLRHITCLLQVISRLRFVRELRPMVDQRYKEMGDRLVITSCARNKSKKDIATAIGVTTHAVTWWEQGRSHPRPPEFGKLINFLKVTYSWLENGVPDIPSQAISAD